MGWPYIFESQFERGTSAEWTSEDDTGSLLDFPHYSTLAGIPGIGPAVPYRGAYCMRIVAGDANAHAVVSTSIVIADTVTRWASFELYVSPNFTATADDTFNIFEYQSAGDVVEAVIGLRITGSTDAVEIGIGELAPTVFAASTLQKGRWYHIDFRVVLSTSDAGTHDLYLDGAATAVASQATIDHGGAVTEGELGTKNTLATTTGTLLFDNFRFDDTQVFPFKQRYPETVTLTTDAHVFVGPGWIESMEVTSNSGTALVYDTDTGNTSNEDPVLNIDTANGRAGFDGGKYFQRGCFCDIGANTKLDVQISTGSKFRGQFGPKAHWSPGAIRHYGQRRAPRPQNV